MESLLWRRAQRYCLAVLKNAFEAGDVSDSPRVIEQEPKEITIRLRLPARAVRNLRTQKLLGNVSSFTDRFTPWEANLYEFALPK
jgi:hypothetical protein